MIKVVDSLAPNREDHTLALGGALAIHIRLTEAGLQIGHEENSATRKQLDYSGGSHTLRSATEYTALTSVGEGASSVSFGSHTVQNTH